MQNEKEITCPSGLRGVVRRYQMEALDVFTDEREIKKGKASADASIAKSIWVRTLDRGPYSFTSDMPPWADEILYGDTYYAIMESRILTRGEHFYFDVRCDSGRCKKKYEWDLNLRDLDVKQLPESSIAVLRDQEGRFSHTLPICGDTVYFNLLTGRVQRRQKQYIEQHGRSFPVIYAARLCGIEGQDRPQYVKYMKSMDPVDYDSLVWAMNDADCGIETGIETECPYSGCETVQDEEVGFGLDFFVQSVSRRRGSRPAVGETHSESTSTEMDS